MLCLLLLFLNSLDDDDDDDDDGGDGNLSISSRQAIVHGHFRAQYRTYTMCISDDNNHKN